MNSIEHNFNVHSYDMCIQGKVALNGSYQKMLGDLELSDSLGSDIVVIELNVLITILGELNAANVSYKNNRKAINEQEIARKPFIYRTQVDQAITNLRKIRCDFTTLILFYPILCEYYKTDRNSHLWFAARNGIDAKVKRWLLKVDTDFNEEGFPTSNGGGKFASKFGFYPVIELGHIDAIWWQFNCMWNVINMLQLCVYDVQKKNYHKITQFVHYFNCIIDIANNIINNFGVCIRDKNLKFNDAPSNE